MTCSMIYHAPSNQDWQHLLHKPLPGVAVAAIGPGYVVPGADVMASGRCFKGIQPEWAVKQVMLS